ncbi:MAG: pantetheine-phosphate adenylyltransferase, partial [Spirochaetales bacterium]
FDPPTLGHLDIIQRAAKLYDRLYIVIADNITKKTLFTAKERKEMLEDILKDYNNIEIHIWPGIVVDFAKNNGIGVIVRGVRAMNDFGYEFELAVTYKQLYPDVEVIFLPTTPKYFQLRSSGIKEMAFFGADISKMVPESVVRRVNEKIKC